MGYWRFLSEDQGRAHGSDDWLGEEVELLVC